MDGAICSACELFVVSDDNEGLSETVTEIKKEAVDSSDLP